MKIIYERLGHGGFVLGSRKCTAKRTITDNCKIWEVTDICDHDSSIIVEKWAGSDQRTLEIIMYRFYFPKSTHATIECLTKVCTDKHKLDCKNDCMTIHSRRRRGTITSKNDTCSHLKSVQVAFNVAVNEAGVNSAIAILPRKTIHPLMGLTMYIVMQFY